MFLSPPSPPLPPPYAVGRTPCGVIFMVVGVSVAAFSDLHFWFDALQIRCCASPPLQLLVLRPCWSGRQGQLVRVVERYTVCNAFDVRLLAHGSPTVFLSAHVLTTCNLHSAELCLCCAGGKLGTGWRTFGGAVLCRNWGFRTATHNYEFLVNFFKAYPEYKHNDLYLSGESYAGVYVRQR